MIMDKSSYLKFLFWILGLAAIIIFYFIADNKVQKLIDENNLLGDSLQVLQKNIDELDSLLKHSKEAKLTAIFDTIPVKKTDSIFVYRFVPRDADANSYSWDFGDGKKSNTKEPEHIFNSNKKSTYEIVLDVKKNEKHKQNKLKIILPAITRVSIKLDSNSFCKQNQGIYKFILKPTGGVVTGPGVIREKNNDYYFQPSHKNVKVGKITFTYKYNQENKSLQVNIKDCSDSIRPKIRLKYTEFCAQDSSKYKFELHPSGCTVEGDGVVVKGNDYYFVPSSVKPGNYTFIGKYKNLSTNYKAKVKDCPRFKAK